MPTKSQLTEALKANPKLRAKFFANLKDAAAEAGLSESELRSDAALEFLGPIDPSELGEATNKIVIISKSDSDKNETSIIIGGHGLQDAIRRAQENL